MLNTSRPVYSGWLETIDVKFFHFLWHKHVVMNDVEISKLDLDLMLKNLDFKLRLIFNVY